MGKISILGDEILMDGFKVGIVQPCKSLSFSEIHSFKMFLHTCQSLHGVEDDRGSYQEGYEEGYDTAREELSDE